MPTDDLVLFVDDDPEVLHSIRRGLAFEPFSMLFASSGEEALAILAKNSAQVVVSDIRMPDMDGLTLLQTVTELYPDTVRLILTGFTHVSTVIAAINKGHVYRYISKPWKLEEDFIPAIRQSIGFSHFLSERRTLLDELAHQNEQLREQNARILELKEQAQEFYTRQLRLTEQLRGEIVPYLYRVQAYLNRARFEEASQLAEQARAILKRFRCEEAESDPEVQTE